MHHIITTTVSAKKGDQQTSRWLIVQDRPFPNLEVRCGRAEWTHVEGILKGALPERYRAYLLRSDIEVKDIPQSWDRTHLAGFGSNPGSLVYRGRALGETSCELARPWPPYNDGLTWRVGHSVPSPADTNWLSEQLGPQFREFISANLAALKQHVIDYLRTRCEREIDSARKLLETADTQIKEAINKL